MDSEQAIEIANNFVKARGTTNEPILRVRQQEEVENKKAITQWVVTFASRNLMGEADVRLVYIDAATEKVWEWVGGRKVYLPEVTVWTTKQKRPTV